MSNRLPYNFPNEADRIYAEAQEFRRLSSNERWMRIFDLIDTGEAIMSHSPHREAALQLRAESEAEWQRRMKELFRRHGY